MRLLIEKLSKLLPKSLLSEYSKIFGFDATEKLLTIFGGMTLKIPSHEDLEKMDRDLRIYQALVYAKSRGRPEFRRVRRTIQAKYGMTKNKVRGIYRVMGKLHRAGKKLVADDQAVGKLKQRRRRK